MPDAMSQDPKENPPQDTSEETRDERKLAEFWKSRIDGATSALKNGKDSKLDDWKRWQDKAAGRWEAKGVKGAFVAVNKPYSIITSVVNQTYSRNPRYAVVAKNPDKEKEADNQTEILNYVVEEIGVKREAKLAVKQSFTIGFSLLKVWWKSKPENETIMRTQVVPSHLPGMMPAVTQVPETVEVDRGLPAVEWVNARSVRFDPDAKRFDHIRWIAQRVVRPTSSVKADKRYKNTDRLKATASSDGQGAAYIRGDDEKVEDSDRTVLWEIEDLENKRLVTIAEGYEWPLRDERDDYADLLEDTGMWVCVEADEDLEGPHGIGIMHIIENLADEKNTIRRRVLNHTKRSLPKVLVTESIDEKALDDLERGEDLSISKVSDLNGVKVLEMPNVPLDNSRAEAQVDADMAETSGSSDPQRGVSAQGSQTATEIAAMGASERVRNSARADQIEEAMKKLGKKLLKLIRAYMKTPQVVRITGADGDPVDWREFTPSEITGEYDVMVEFGSTILKDEMEKRQLDQNLYNLVASDPFVNRLEILKDIIRDYGKKNVDRYLNTALINREAYLNAIVQAVQAGNVDLAVATVEAIIQNVMPPAKGPVTPMPGVPSARPQSVASQLAAGPPGGGEGPAGALRTPGQIRAAWQGSANIPRLG